MSNLQSTVNSKLTDIVKSTTLSIQLCNNLKDKELVTQDEYEELTNFVCSGRHSQGASYLFTTVVRKIATAEEEKFIEALREGKNYRLVEILRSNTSGGANRVGSHFPLHKLRKEEIDFLRGFPDKFSQKGKFEGLNFEDEEPANEFLSGSVDGGVSEWRLLEEEGVLETADVDKFIGRVRKVMKCLQNGTLWWNPNAVLLPPNFIPRRVERLTNSGKEEESKLLSEILKADEPFLWLVDPPMMGKSTVTTKLEEEWRNSIPSQRVIVRINLNLVQHQLQEQKEKDDFSLVTFLKRFVPFLPIDSLCRLQGVKVGVVVLLDALDEVLPQHSLLRSPEEAKERDFTSLVLRRPDITQPLRLEKVFLTTRPHLRSLVEKQFGVNAHSLLPLNFKEQILFLSKEVSGVFKLSKDEAEIELNSLPDSSLSLLENPLMIFLFAQVIKINGKGGGSTGFDLCGLYEKFMLAKHTIHVVEKEAGDPKDPQMERRVKILFEENLPFYNATALTQLRPLINEDLAPFYIFPDLNKQKELLSFGLLTANSLHQLHFVHLSFAEFLHARLLMAPSTPAPLRDTLFTQIYSDYYPLENVEKFVLHALRTRRAEFPSERLLSISHQWLQSSTWLPTFRGFVKGRLFTLLGEELLCASNGVGEDAKGCFAFCLLRKADVKFLRRFANGNFSPGGKFEGLILADEEDANELWRLMEDASWKPEDEEYERFSRRLRSVVKCLEEGSLWWNPVAVPIPPNFIPRRVQRLTTSLEEAKSKDITELTNSDEPFLWLVDLPGSGKSTLTTKMEEEWRRSTPSDRLIVHINLSLAQQELQQQNNTEDLSLVTFLKRFVPFVPIESLCSLRCRSVGVVVLLDGLDELLPQQQETMLHILHKLLSAQEAKQHDFTSRCLLRLEKLLLTTRPHLCSLVEEEFGVTAHALLPLSLKEQIEFVSKEVSREFELSEDEAERKLKSLPPSSRSLMGNPQMLFLFVQAIKVGGEGRLWAESDLFSLYERFLEAKHTIHVAEKEAGHPNHPNTQRRMKLLLEENFPFYYATALTQLKPKKTKTWAKFLKLPDLKKREELLNIGLLTQSSPGTVYFVDFSFAEFLYAHLLTISSASTPFRDILFREIYSDHPPLRNVEEFLLCALRRRKSEFKSERLLPLSSHWLPGSTWWQRLRGQKKGETLERFMNGPLFRLLGDELLPNVELTNN